MTTMAMTDENDWRDCLATVVDLVKRLTLAKQKRVTWFIMANESGQRD